MRRHRIGGFAVAGALTLVVAACGGSSKSSSGGGAATLNGAGSTLAAPIYQQWASNVSSQGLTVNYQATGSGAGIAQLQAGTVDFAGSDPPMKPSEIAAAKGPVAEFPIAFGAIEIVYNLPSVKSGLKLDGKTAADIFQGKVKTWNDPEIKALNPGLGLPGTSITIIHRSDSSGTTKGFTTFLSDYSSAWTNVAGKPDKIVNWPTGTGAKGNSGVAAAVKQTPGAIGYLDQAYAIQSGATYASVKNSKATFVAPTLAATSAAAIGIPIPANLAISTINSPNPAAYPIVSQTFLIVYQDMCKAGVSQSVAQGVKKFISYGLGSAGQNVEKQLSYAPLPPVILAKDEAQLKTLTCNGSPLP
jgi:phosphate transport system substrate-binding protein